MLAAILEKLAYGIAVVVLLFVGSLAGSMLAGGVIDLILAALFVIALRRTPPAFCGRSMTAPQSSSRDGDRALARFRISGNVHQPHHRCRPAPLENSNPL